MIVYRQKRHAANPRAVLRAASKEMQQLLAMGVPARDAIVSVLIDAGELASAVADANAPECDGMQPATVTLLEMTVHLACAADAVWQGAPEEASRALHDALSAANRCGTLELPPTVMACVSEGFAYYALGPELYAEAARQWMHQQRPRVVWCIGLRTIGLTI